MRIQFLSLLAACAVSIPVSAQSQAIDQGNKTSKIAFVYTGEILPGQEQAFRQTVKKVIAAVERESGTQAYYWSMHADGKTFDVLEVYKDSDAVVAHIKDVLPQFGEELGKTQKEVRFVVYGDPDNEAKKALEPLHPDYASPFAGFIH
jgi:quinol monooxygenase YgiN